MRWSAFVESARDLSHGHLGCAFDDRVHWYTLAADFVRDGLAENQLVQYVAPGSRATVADELAQVLAILGRRAGDEDVRAVPLSEFLRFQDGRELIDADASLAALAVGHERAVARGYSGTRTILDATPIARTEAQRDALARFEYLADRSLNSSPLSALCGYDARELGWEACRELVCLHPLASEADTSFRLHASTRADLALAGEIDLASEHQFAVALERMLGLTRRHETVGHGETVIDVHDLGYLDHRGLDIMDRLALQYGRTIRLINAPPVITRLVQLMDPLAVVLGPPEAEGEPRRVWSGGR